jgi:hypothetical protein
MPDRRGGSVYKQNGHQGGGDNEASQQPAATYRNRSGKEDDTRGHRQGKGAVSGRCAGREDLGEKWAYRGKSHRNAQMIESILETTTSS